MWKAAHHLQLVQILLVRLNHLETLVRQREQVIDEINRLTVGVTGAAGLGAGAGAATGAGFFLNILNIPPPTRIDIFKLEVDGNMAVLSTLLSWKRWRSAAGTPSHSAISPVNADAVTSDPTSKHLVLPDKSL